MEVKAIYKESSKKLIEVSLISNESEEDEKILNNVLSNLIQLVPEETLKNIKDISKDSELNEGE